MLAKVEKINYFLKCNAYSNTLAIVSDFIIFSKSLMPFPPIYGHPFVRSSRDKTTLLPRVIQIQDTGSEKVIKVNNLPFE